LYAEYSLLNLSISHFSEIDIHYEPQYRDLGVFFILTADRSGKYTIHSLGSEKTVVVPEFDGMLIALIPFMATVIMAGAVLYGKRNSQGKLGPI